MRLLILALLSAISLAQTDRDEGDGCICIDKKFLSRKTAGYNCVKNGKVLRDRFYKTSGACMQAGGIVRDRLSCQTISTDAIAHKTCERWQDLVPHCCMQPSLPQATPQPKVTDESEDTCLCSNAKVLPKRTAGFKCEKNGALLRDKFYDSERSCRDAGGKIRQVITCQDVLTDAKKHATCARWKPRVPHCCEGGKHPGTTTTTAASAKKVVQIPSSTTPNPFSAIESDSCLCPGENMRFLSESMAGVNCEKSGKILRDKFYTTRLECTKIGGKVKEVLTCKYLSHNARAHKKCDRWAKKLPHCCEETKPSNVDLRRPQESVKQKQHCFCESPDLFQPTVIAGVHCFKGQRRLKNNFYQTEQKCKEAGGTMKNRYDCRTIVKDAEQVNKCSQWKSKFPMCCRKPTTTSTSTRAPVKVEAKTSQKKSDCLCAGKEIKNSVEAGGTCYAGKSQLKDEKGHRLVSRQTCSRLGGKIKDVYNCKQMNDYARSKKKCDDWTAMLPHCCVGAVKQAEPKVTTRQTTKATPRTSPAPVKRAPCLCGRRKVLKTQTAGYHCSKHGRELHDRFYSTRSACNAVQGRVTGVITCEEIDTKARAGETCNQWKKLVKHCCDGNSVIKEKKAAITTTIKPKIGCDGVPDSGKIVDDCGVCGGDNTSCAGCDGVPHSGKLFDECGVCGGDGSSCKGSESSRSQKGKEPENLTPPSSSRNFPNKKEKNYAEYEKRRKKKVVEETRRRMRNRDFAVEETPMRDMPAFELPKDRRIRGGWGSNNFYIFLAIILIFTFIYCFWIAYQAGQRQRRGRWHKQRRPRRPRFIYPERPDTPV